jgi:membrane protease YdiL (CAAX protease family)
MNQRPLQSVPAPAPASARAQVRLSAQVLTGLVLCLLAALILYFTRERPWHLFSGPLDPLWQLLIGQGLALVASGVSWLLYRRSGASEASLRTVAAYARLDLRGHNPLWIALCAAIGEELLFRAALQPLLGVWIVSVLFLASHVPLVQLRRVRRLEKPALVQAVGVFAASVALGFIYQYVGLLAALLVHLWIDIVALLVVRSVLESRD